MLFLGKALDTIGAILFLALLATCAAQQEARLKPDPGYKPSYPSRYAALAMERFDDCVDSGKGCTYVQPRAGIRGRRLNADELSACRSNVTETRSQVDHSSIVMRLRCYTDDQVGEFYVNVVNSPGGSGPGWIAYITTFDKDQAPPFGEAMDEQPKPYA